jgi:hypothetical protein
VWFGLAQCTPGHVQSPQQQKPLRAHAEVLLAAPPQSPLRHSNRSTQF